MIGRCDQAIVGGTQLCLGPFTNQVCQSSGINARDGLCKVWDERADGYSKGEAVVCFLLQKKSEAKRIYATVLHSGANTDGYKKMGMFFPSTEVQTELFVKVYKEANVNPLDVTYIEAHATGTKVRKPFEINQFLL